MATSKHPNRISPRHSAISVGDPEQDAVFHVCISCGYLGEIEPEHMERGWGYDHLGYRRRPCSRCVTLIECGLC